MFSHGFCGVGSDTIFSYQPTERKGAGVARGSKVVNLPTLMLFRPHGPQGLPASGGDWAMIQLPASGDGGGKHDERQDASERGGLDTGAKKVKY